MRRLVRPRDGIIPRLLRRRTIAKLSDLDRFLHLVRSLIAQVARLVCRTLRAKRFVLWCRPRNHGDGIFHVGFVHNVVLAQLSGVAVGLDVEKEGEEGGEPAGT